MFGVEFLGKGGSMLDSDHFPLVVTGHSVVTISNRDHTNAFENGPNWFRMYNYTLMDQDFDLVAYRPHNRDAWIGGHTTKGYIELISDRVTTVDLYFIRFTKGMPRTGDFGMEVLDAEGLTVMSTDHVFVNLTGAQWVNQSSSRALGLTEAVIITQLPNIIIRFSIVHYPYGLYRASTGGQRVDAWTIWAGEDGGGWGWSHWGYGNLATFLFVDVANLL